MTPITTDSYQFETIPANMQAVVTLGTGGLDQLQLKEIPVPTLRTHEVLVKVLAAGVNNNEINTRLGWYSSSVTEGTAETLGHESSRSGWNQPTPFPLIQGTDCCGRVVQVSSSQQVHWLGKRVLVRPCMRPHGYSSMESVWMASDFDGAFAQYVRVPENEVFLVNCDWTDIELASVPCAYGSAENMVHRATVTSADHVLITGGSGGIGTAALQLCKMRGARVTSIVGESKMEQVQDMGADRVIPREGPLFDFCQKESVDVVIDSVGGKGFSELLQVLKRGGRYASCGAIAGPMVAFDLRALYLKDLTLIGSTAWDQGVFPRLIAYIESEESGKIRPRVDRVFQLSEIAQAQTEFLKKNHVGKIVLVPRINQPH